MTPSSRLTPTWEEPSSPGLERRFDSEAFHTLSRFAILRRSTRGLVAESAITGWRLNLSSRSRLTLFLSFLEPRRPADVLTSVGAAKADAVCDFLLLCHHHRLLVETEDSGLAPDESSLVGWEPHDLFLHQRSRRGDHPYPVGATYAYREVVPPQPVVKPRYPGAVLSLPLPPEEEPAPDGSLFAILEARRSRYSIEPVPLPILSEFLYRTCRITNGDALAGGSEAARKVYPSGGGIHSLEVYLIVTRCPGLPAGLYHYGSLSHELSPLEFDQEALQVLLNDARTATGRRLEASPSVLLLLTSRFGRVTAKYQSLAYAAVLKEVGCLFQTMYLVATALGLAPCALGAGDSSAFHQATGLDPFQEPPVGEFVLGG